MITLADMIQTKEIKLKYRGKELTITVREKMTIADSIVAARWDEDSMAQIYARLIVDWNLFDKEWGQKLPINKESVASLPTEIINDIMSVIKTGRKEEDIEEEKKKTSSSN